MRILRWMNVNKVQDRIKEENIQDKLKVAPVEDKMGETRLRWCGHVQKRRMDETIKKNDNLEVIDISMRRQDKRKLKQKQPETS